LHCIFSLQVHRQREVYKLERVDKETWRYVPQVMPSNDLG
jgi:hypothetical protein